MKRAISLILSTLILCGLFSSCSLIPRGIGRTLSDGFWVAELERNQESNFYLEYGNDLGFVFKPAEDESFDGIAITCSQNSWRYLIDEEDTVQISRYDPNEEEYLLMFSGSYDKESDDLVLIFTEEAEDYYETLSSTSTTLILTHFEDSRETNLQKKLLFDTWSTVDYDKKAAMTDGFDGSQGYNEFRNMLLLSNSNVILYKFYFNWKDFDLSEGNARKIYYDADDKSWYGKAHEYQSNPKDQKIISLTPYESSDTVFYQYDKELDALISKAGPTIYRVTSFADPGGTGKSGKPRPETESSTTQAVPHTLEAIQEALEQSMRGRTAKPLFAHWLPLLEDMITSMANESEKREWKQVIQEASITYFFYDLPSAASLNDGIFIKYYGYTSQQDQTNGPFDYRSIKERIEAFYAEEGQSIHILDLGFMEFDVYTDDSEDAEHLTDAWLGIVETDNGYFIFSMSSM